jgi:hypothetical protein
LKISDVLLGAFTISSLFTDLGINELQAFDNIRRHFNEKHQDLE